MTHPTQPLEPFRLDPATRIGAVTLAVADLDRMARFYRDIIGLTLLARSSQSVALGLAKTSLIRLEARPDGRQPGHATGLFHLALLLPSRRDLGHWLTHLAEHGYPLSGTGDHLVSEALYLSDPEGNGLELYCDRPRETWQYDADGRLKMDTLAVDVRSLLAEAPPAAFTGLPAGTTMGHVHLRVNDLEQAIRFYRDGLGFDLMTTFPGAGFLSAGGYHHHLGVNVWQSNGVASPPPGSLGLINYEIVLPSLKARDRLVARLPAVDSPIGGSDKPPRLRDPAGNELILTLA